MAQAVDSSIARPLGTGILLAQDGDPATMLAGILPSVSTALSCITHAAMGSALGTAWSTPLDGTGLHALGDDHRRVPWPRREDEGHQLAAPCSPQVDFGTETAPAPAEGFGLWVPVFAPAACWWARMRGPSREWRSHLSWLAASACVCTAAKS
jgi:hypothetical protein